MPKPEALEPPTLNLVPIMNLVTILIPVLLMAIKSLELAAVDTTLPAISPVKDTNPVDGTPPLRLTVEILPDGFKLIGAHRYLSSDESSDYFVPCTSQGRCQNAADYDYQALASTLDSVKRMAAADETEANSLIFLPAENIRYEIVMATMDATRELNGQKLFPNVVFAAGVR